jgi:biotin carboxylase
VAKSLVYTHEPIAGLPLNDIAEINDNIFNQVPYGITHVEYIIHDKKMYLVEAAIRGGGTNVSATVIPNVSGVDVNTLLIDDAFGICTGSKIKSTDKINITPVSLNFFNFKPGTVKSITGEDFLFNCDNVIEHKFNITKGDIIKNPEDDATRHGYYITTAPTTEELIDVNNKVYNTVRVTYN